MGKGMEAEMGGKASHCMCSQEVKRDEFMLVLSSSSLF